jgi:hypothetical protein
MSVNATLEGVGKIVQEFRKLEQAAKQRTVTAINRVAGEIFAQSQREVPVDTGNLRASGRITAANEQNLTSTLSYGGTAAEYALAVHERHATQSKYLEKPFRENQQRFREEMINAAKSVTD